MLIETQLQLIDGALTLRIPLIAGGEELLPLTRGLGHIDGDYLCIVVAEWVAQALAVGAGDFVVVVRFNNAKGTGRIVSDEFHDELWVHFSSIAMEGFKTIAEGQAVEHTREIWPGPHGMRPVAQRVVPIT